MVFYSSYVYSSSVPVHIRHPVHGMDRLASIEACDEELAKPGLEPITEEEQHRVAAYMQAIYLTKADFAEKKAQLPPLRSNATAAAQAARTTALQDLERELEQALTFIDTDNESVMLLKMRSDLRRPVLRRKLDLIAQQAQQAEEAREREAAQRGEIEREANRDALVAVVQRPPAALPEALPDNALPVDRRPQRQPPQQHDTRIRGEPALDHVGNLLLQQQPAAMPPLGPRPPRTGHIPPIAEHVLPQPLQYTGLQPPWAPATQDHPLARKTAWQPWQTGMPHPLASSLLQEASMDSAARTYPVIGELLEAVGHKSFTRNKAAFNAHQKQTLQNNLATASSATKMAEEAASAEERAEWFQLAANQYKAASDISVATAEVNKFSELVPFKEVINVIKDQDPGPRFLLGALAALPSKYQSLFDRLGSKKAEHKSTKHKRKSATRRHSSDDSTTSTDTDSSDSKDDRRKRRRRHRQRSQDAPHASRYDAENKRPNQNGGRGGYFRPPPGGPCYLCNNVGHLAIACPRAANMSAEERAATFAAGRAAWQRNGVRPNGE